MHRSLHIVAVLALALPTGGCFMAVRHVAREANRSGVQDKAVRRFPVGTPVDTARASLTADGYRCLDIPADRKVKAHISCWPARRTNGAEKFLIGGNWRYDLYAENSTLTKLHISSARHGMKRRRSVRANPDSFVTPPPAL